MIQQTSLQSYLLLDPEDLTNQQKRIYKLLCTFGPRSDADIVKETGLPISTVTARRNELIERGLVRKQGTKKNFKTDRTVIAWGVY